MIKLFKIDEPDILQANKQEWTERYLKLLKEGEEIPTSLKTKYKLKEIKSQIVKETKGKCAYCESFISHISPGDIEHILPKSRRPDLIFEWNNLTLACEECNRTRKNDYYNPSDPLVNPYEDNPSDHIFAAGPIIFSVPANRKGDITISILDLNRAGLLEKRIERLMQIKILVDKWAQEENPTVKEIIKEQLLQESDSQKEYSFFLNAFYKNAKVIS